MTSFDSLRLMSSILIATQLCACGVEIRDRNQAPPEVQGKVLPNVMIPMTGQNFVIEEGAQPLEYRVRLLMPEGATYVVRTAHKGAVAERFWADGAELVDTKVQSGESYEYSFYRNPTEPILTTTVHVPKDFAINAVTQLKDLNSSQPVRRLFMGPKAVIQTGSDNYEFRVESLLAEPGATVQTFPENSVSGVRVAGASGGLGRILIVKAVGEIRIELRGQNGAQGVPGAAHLNRAAAGKSYGATVRNRPDCAGMAVGGAGANGARGGVGGNGQNGGATGSLEINVQDDSEFKVHAQFMVGRGGNSGPGGPGQEGGLGGAAETRRVYRKLAKGIDQLAEVEDYQCPAVADGPVGQTGATGPEGSAGVDGTKGFFCLRVAGSCRL